VSSIAVCPECGEARPDATDYCKVCGWNPNQSEEEMARGLYFSARRFEGIDASKSPQWESELAGIGERLRAGAEVEADQAELVRLRKRARAEFPPPKAPVAGLLLVALAFFAVIAVVLWFLYAMVRRTG
jgi:hypothetical protein